MRQLPPKVLEEIYFKSIIPAVIYGIVVLGNCSSAMLNSLNPIHERAARLIHDQDDLAVDPHEGEANLLFHVSNMKLANNLFNIEDQQFGHFLID